MSINTIADYHSCCFRINLFLRINVPIFLQTPLNLMSIQNVCQIFSKACISHQLGKIFKMMLFRLLQNAFVSQKSKSRPFTHAFQVFIITPRQRKITHSPTGSVFFVFFLKICFLSSRKEHKIMLGQLNPYYAQLIRKKNHSVKQVKWRFFRQ